MDSVERQCIKILRAGHAIDWHKCNRGVLCISAAARAEYAELTTRETVALADARLAQAR